MGKLRAGAPVVARSSRVPFTHPLVRATVPVGPTLNVFVPPATTPAVRVSRVFTVTGVPRVTAPEAPLRLIVRLSSDWAPVVNRSVPALPAKLEASVRLEVLLPEIEPLALVP